MFKSERLKSPRLFPEDRLAKIPLDPLSFFPSFARYMLLTFLSVKPRS